MGNLHLVTGHKGTAHVTAADHASLHAALFGEGEYVLSRGSEFESAIISNNQIRIADGDLLMQGRHIRLNEGSYIDLAVENGQQGMVRNDLVVARYTKDSLSGIEDCNLVVIKGTPSSGTATDPDFTAGSIIHDNVLLADMPLYRIRVVNLNIEELVPMFKVLLTVDAKCDKLENDATVMRYAFEMYVKSKCEALKNTVDAKCEALENTVDAKCKALEESVKTNTVTVALSPSGWSNKTQTVSVAGVTASNTVLVSPAPESYLVYAEAVIRCTGQAEGKLTFACDDVPGSSVTVNIALL